MECSLSEADSRPIRRGLWGILRKAVAGAVFVWEAVSVILQVGSYKTRGGKRIFLIAPYHHHLQFKGWPESRVVMSFWIGTAVCSVLALGLQKVL